MAAKNSGKAIFVKSRQQTLQITCRSDHSISNGFPDKWVLRFMHKFKMATKKWRESDFWKTSPVHSADTLWVQNVVKITLSRTVSEINELLRCTQKFKMAAKSGGKAIFAKSCQYSEKIEINNRNRSISHRFQDKCTFAFYTEIHDGR